MLLHCHDMLSFQPRRRHAGETIFFWKAFRRAAGSSGHAAAGPWARIAHGGPSCTMPGRRSAAGPLRLSVPVHPVLDQFVDDAGVGQRRDVAERAE
ncbi:hypothetical protein, partial [Paracoccus sp. AS002]|uniref:hypothetical protein n=1 Tax=Paracoccus sp. AS002 TaxID=3019545 RepID=UPI0023E76C4A